MLADFLKFIGKAPSKTAVKSEANKARNAVRKNPKMTGAKEEKALERIDSAVDSAMSRIEKRKKDAEPKPKRSKADIPAAKRKQSGEERSRAATGNVSAKTTTQRNKKEGVGSMVSYTSMERGKAIAEAGKDLRAGKITQAEHDRIIDRIDAKNEGEKIRAGNKASENARSRKMQDKVSLPDKLPASKSIKNEPNSTRKKKPSEMTRAELREALEKEDRKSKAARAKTRDRRGYSKGGLSTSSPRKGHIDMRKKGLFR